MAAENNDVGPDEFRLAVKAICYLSKPMVPEKRKKLRTFHKTV